MNWFEQSPAQMICLYERFAFLLQNECIVLAICVIFSCFFLQFIQHMHASSARREIAREREPTWWSNVSDKHLSRYAPAALYGVQRSYNKRKRELFVAKETREAKTFDFTRSKRETTRDQCLLPCDWRLPSKEAACTMVQTTWMPCKI